MSFSRTINFCAVMAAFCFGLCDPALANPSDKKPIVFTIKEGNLFQTMFSGNKCVLKYSIDNRHDGTIYGLAVKVEANGDPLRVTSLTAVRPSTENTEIKIEANEKQTFVGGSEGVNEFASFSVEESCSEIRSIRIASVPEHLCAIRKLPEEVKCRSIIELRSSTNFLEIK